MRRLLLVPLAAALAAALAPAADTPAISWKKTVLDSKFRGEGVAVADANKDGKIDVLAGEWWYEAPDWKPHQMQPPGDYGDGEKGYSKVFACWAEDINHDSYPDLIVVDFPGEPCYWLENPKGQAEKDGKPVHWKRHYIWHSACNETPIYADLFGTGKRVLIMGVQPIERLGGNGKQLQTSGNQGQMVYLTPNPKDPTLVWELHPISEPSTPGQWKDGKEVPGTRKEAAGTQKFSHGLGVGDLNGDKRADVITLGGWWEQPEKADGVTAWKFHPGGVTDAASDIFAFDVDNDGKADILHTSAHKYGIWWVKQLDGKNGHPEWKKNDIFKDLISETHAVHFQDVDGDGQNDLITGKRWWSHGSRGEPGADKPAAIYWLKVTRDPDGLAKFTPNLIDDDSGIGTQFVVADINGDKLLDVVSSNKKGVRVILQERK